jgi:choline dehydrogenase-like flavoprotein
MTAERRLTFVLRLVALLFLLLAPVIAVAGVIHTGFLSQPPFVAHSVGGALIIGFTALYAAGSIRRRINLVAVAIGALLLSAAALASMLLFAQTGGEMDVWFGDAAVKDVLWAFLIVDVVVASVLAGLLVRFPRRAVRAAGAEGTPNVLSRCERQLRGILIAFAAIFVLAAIAVEAAPFIHSTQEVAGQLPWVASSVFEFSLLAMLCLYAVSDLRRNMALVGPVIATLVLVALSAGAYVIKVSAGTDYTVALLGGNPQISTLLWWTVLASVAPAAVLFAASRGAWKARYGLSFMWPAPYRALIAVADVLLPESERRLEPEGIAARVEAFLADFRAHRRWLYRIALAAIQLAPLIEVRPRPRINPPLSELDRDSRHRFLRDHFQRLPRQGRHRFVRHMKQVTIRIAQQLSYAGYYGAPATFPSIGYQPFTERDRYAELDITEPGFHPLDVTQPGDVDVEEIEADVCIIGSGAGGSILAHELARLGRQVLILERGQYVEPREFTEDEVEMIGRLYADGLMQQTEDWRFTILQGSCVGGSTTVNNAVCFPPPEPVLARWNDPALHDAGLNLDGLHASTAAVEEFLSVARQLETPLNRSATKYVDGAAGLGVSPDRLDVDVVKANIKGCYGSGYCNIGCRWGKKLSMLETALPWAQRDFPGRLRIVSECEVERIRMDPGSSARVVGLEAKLAGKRFVSVRANAYVLSAGTIASSYLMIRSGVGRSLPVGKGFAANMGAPLTAEFDQPQYAYDGLQISHYGVPRDNGFVFETWFNPPVSQALNLPGWFKHHFDNMRRYDHLMAVGVLVGTASNGYIRRALTGGPGVVFVPEPHDLQTLSRGLRLLGEILFEAGAKRVMVNAWALEEFTSADQLDRLDEICADPDYIALGTGHPQGGNALSRDPRRGVVGPDFKVHGYTNLYVCDASVFPTSLTVNPQLTVMSLAHYAAPGIAEDGYAGV